MDTPSETSTVEEQVKHAVQQFRTKQKQSDDSYVAWLQSCIEGIEQATDATAKKQKQKNLASYWGTTSWSAFKSDHLDNGSLHDLLPDDQSRSASAVTEPLPEPQRQAFLEGLSNAINRFYDEDDPEFKPVNLPEDYVALSSITSGLRDADFRDSGTCGIDDISQLQLDKVVPEPQKLPCRREFKRGWDIDTGFILSRGLPEHDNWLVYSYCARMEVTQHGDKSSGGDIQPHERI